MGVVRARYLELPSRVSAALALAPRPSPPAPPAWRTLAIPLLLVMAAWATAIARLPDAQRWLADWGGGLGVVAILFAWHRRNAVALACRRDLSRHGAQRVQVRLIRSRRPPLPDLGGPRLPPSRRRVSAGGPPLPS
jgi:hypothetical protein